MRWAKHAVDGSSASGWFTLVAAAREHSPRQLGALLIRSSISEACAPSRPASLIDDRELVNIEMEAGPSSRAGQACGNATRMTQYGLGWLEVECNRCKTRASLRRRHSPEH